MLVRSVGGRWCAVGPVSERPDAIAELCGDDVGELLELGEPRTVLARLPEFHGVRGPEALCLRPDGVLSLLVSTWSEPAELTVMRVATTVGTLRTWGGAAVLERFAPGSADPASWCDELASMLDATLAEGRFELLLLADELPSPSLVAALGGLTTERGLMRCFSLALLRGDTMEAMQPRELELGLEVPEPERPPAPVLTEAPRDIGPAPPEDRVVAMIPPRLEEVVEGRVWHRHGRGA